MSAEIEAIARRGRQAALQLAALDSDHRNRALDAVRAALAAGADVIAAANRADKEAAEKLVASGEMSPALFKRLDLEGAKFETALAGIDDVARLSDPVGHVDYALELDSGLELRRVSCPLGVIGVIFEARPDAAIQIAALTVKSANAVILKGGREAERTNRAVAEIFQAALESAGVPGDAVQLISTRDEVRDLLDQDRWIDLIIPRGSNELVRSIQESTRIPVLGHADGICAIYLDESADLEIARRVVVDSKCGYPAACNAVETLLVHPGAIDRVLPAVGAALAEAGVEMRADETARAALSDQGVAATVAARPADFDTEFLDLVVAVKVVDGLEQAVAHINEHGSHHTDAIVTEDAAAAERFCSLVDSAGVYHNASTRFADGFRYGLGAEVGISTNKTHARGPVGLEGLVIYKYRLNGSGQVAGDYGPGKRPFTHRRLDG